jgi:DNA polymerase
MTGTGGGREDLERLLAWYVDAGADEAIGEAPVNRFAAPRAAPRADATPAAASPPRAPLPPPPLLSADDAAAGAREIAAGCADLEALRAALEAFEGCALKKTATQLVFADGNPEANVMLIGEAPGGDEDRVGRPFVGPAGKLLDRMLGAIGLDRTSAYITNIVPWRPPGNRNPSANEVTICLPFLRRHIELVGPKILVLVGGVPASALLGTRQGITKIRGRWHIYRGEGGADDATGIPAMPIFHTAYLLRSPAKKKEAWRDMLEIRRRLKESG